MRLIDADTLKQELQWCLEQSSDTERWRDVIERVDAAPTVEPKRGAWKPLFEEYAIDWMQCSECGTEFFGKTNYCPNCGARMEGDTT